MKVMSDGSSEIMELHLAGGAIRILCSPAVAGVRTS
jgi:hypothetical protein